MEIEGKVVAITGAGRGIGAATAGLLARRGARVVLAGRDRAALDAVAHEITRADGEAAVQPCDVTDAHAVAELVTCAVRRFGRLDAFVSNAGIAIAGPLADGELADWNTMIDVNLGGVLHAIAAALPVFREQGSGQFITVTSTAARRWAPGQGVYAASKAGVLAVCEVLRQEVGPEIRATTVSPGFVDTEFITHTRDPAQLAAFQAARATMAMAPSEVAEAIAFAIGQPPEVNLGEITIRSAAQP